MLLFFVEQSWYIGLKTAQIQLSLTYRRCPMYKSVFADTLNIYSINYMCTQKTLRIAEFFVHFDIHSNITRP